MKFQIRLADGWRDLHRKSSVRFSALAAMVPPGAVALREAWSSMPDDLKSVVPNSMQQAISYTVLAGAFLALRYTAVNKEESCDDDK